MFRSTGVIRRHRPHEPVGLLHLGAVVVDEVGRLLRVPHRLQAALAHLQRHQGGEIVLALADQLGGPAQDADPLLPRPAGPAALRLLGPPDREVDLRRPGGREAAEQERGVDRRAVVERLARARDRLASDQVGVAGAGRRPDLGERRVEAAVEVVQVAGWSRCR